MSWNDGNWSYENKQAVNCPRLPSGQRVGFWRRLREPAIPHRNRVTANIRAGIVAH